MSDLVACPSCGGAMIYLSALHRYQCYLCVAADREEEDWEVPMPWWIWMAMAFVILAVVILLMFPEVIAAVETEDLENPDDAHLYIPLGPTFLMVGSVMVTVLVLDLVDRKPPRERCPDCGRVLKLTPAGTYYCMKCKKHWPAKDIEVEVIE